MIHFSMLQSSGHATNHTPKKGITFTSNQPRPSLPAQTLTEVKEPSLWQTLTGSTPKQSDTSNATPTAPTSTEPQVPAAIKGKTNKSPSGDDCSGIVTENLPLVTKAIPASSSSLGTSYKKPNFPAQIPNSFNPASLLNVLLLSNSGKGTSESYAAYIARLIKDGQYASAYDEQKDPNIGERTGCALSEKVNDFVGLYKKQREERLALLQKQRSDLEKEIATIYLITIAASQPYAQAPISAKRATEILVPLKELQREIEEDSGLVIAELNAIDFALKNMRSEIYATHPKQPKEYRISPQRQSTK